MRLFHTSDWHISSALYNCKNTRSSKRSWTGWPSLYIVLPTGRRIDRTERDSNL